MTYTGVIAANWWCFTVTFLEWKVMACEVERHECTCSLVFVCFVDIDWGIPRILQAHCVLFDMMETDKYRTLTKYTQRCHSLFGAYRSLRQSADPAKAQPDVGCTFQFVNFWHAVNVAVNSNCAMSLSCWIFCCTMWFLMFSMGFRASSWCLLQQWTWCLLEDTIGMRWYAIPENCQNYVATDLSRPLARLWEQFYKMLGCAPQKQETIR